MHQEQGGRPPLRNSTALQPFGRTLFPIASACQGENSRWRAALDKRNKRVAAKFTKHLTSSDHDNHVSSSALKLIRATINHHRLVRFLRAWTGTQHCTALDWMKSSAAHGNWQVKRASVRAVASKSTSIESCLIRSWKKEDCGG